MVEPTAAQLVSALKETVGVGNAHAAPFQAAPLAQAYWQAAGVPVTKVHWVVP
jgi:hypothetical protein